MRLFWYVYIHDWCIVCSTLGRMFNPIPTRHATSIARESRESNGVQRPSDYLHGRRLRKHFEAMEQTSRRLYVKRKPAKGNTRKGVLYSICDVVSACLSIGTDASSERIHQVISIASIANRRHPFPFPAKPLKQELSRGIAKPGKRSSFAHTACFSPATTRCRRRNAATLG